MDAGSAVMAEALALLFSIDVHNTLGEGIQWHADSQTLWWTDIQNSRLYRYDWASKRLDQWATPERLTAFGILSARPVQLLASFASGFALYEPERDHLAWLARPERHLPGNRFNDGRVDRQGRFWSGTMVENNHGQCGSLYRLDADGATAVLPGLSIPNALCWSPDGRLMYHADTPRGEIRLYDFDPVTGQPSGERLFARVPQGKPDGAAVDASGYLLCALWGGQAVARFAPTGELVALHDLPVSQPTCVALGGPDMNVLFVSSAHEDMTAEQRAAEPLAGSVLAYTSPYVGLSESVPDPARLPPTMAG